MVSAIKLSRDAETDNHACPQGVYNLVGRAGMKK